MEFDITPSVGAFREVISASWLAVRQISSQDTTGSFLDDWLQANWERIVEASIQPSMHVVLSPYGEGADCNIGSSRVWRPELLPNTAVSIQYIGNDALLNAIDGSVVDGPLELSHFCTVKDGWPVVDAPFDYAALASSDVSIILAENLRYYVELR